VLAGRCHEGEAGLAYGVLVEALRSTLARPELAPPLAAIPERWLAEAARLLPELGAGRALPAPAPLNQPGAPILFFEGLCQTIQALAGPGGVLWVDDAQWIDSASLDLLALPGAPPGQPTAAAAAGLARRREPNCAASGWLGALSAARRSGLPAHPGPADTG
jgi:hypothetical protein